MNERRRGPRIRAVAMVASLAGAVSGCARPTTGASPAASATTEAAPAPPSTLDHGTGEAETRAPTSPVQAPAEREPSPAPLESCGLTATLSRSPSGSFHLTLKNDGPKALALVLPGDGSGSGMRTPTLTWTATSGGAPVPIEPAPRCGLTNRIEAKEIFTLAPGASSRMSEWLSPPSLPRGTYELRLTYRNDPRHLGGEIAVAEEARQPLEASSACEVTTAPLRAALR